jgi:uncharacterized membrane protein HdeD (DUF308 family)
MITSIIQCIRSINVNVLVHGVQALKRVASNSYVAALSSGQIALIDPKLNAITSFVEKAEPIGLFAHLLRLNLDFLFGNKVRSYAACMLCGYNYS